MTTARPILFSGAMIRALLDGRKCQTRRCCKYPIYSNGIRYDAATGDIPCHCDELPPSAMLMDVKRGPLKYTTSNIEGWTEACPYGMPGDLLWCRETWQHAPSKYCYCPQPSEASPCDHWVNGTGCVSHHGEVIYLADHREGVRTWRPSIHMPRWASRLTLRISEVRVERLQEISEADAIAEGIEKVPEPDRFGCDWISPAAPETRYNKAAFAYEALWSSIHGYHSPNSWSTNPWVWALTFTIEKRNVDELLREAA